MLRKEIPAKQENVPPAFVFLLPEERKYRLKRAVQSILEAEAFVMPCKSIFFSIFYC